MAKGVDDPQVVGSVLDNQRHNLRVSPCALRHGQWPVHGKAIQAGVGAGQIVLAPVCRGLLFRRHRHRLVVRGRQRQDRQAVGLGREQRRQDVLQQNGQGAGDPGGFDRRFLVARLRRLRVGAGPPEAQNADAHRSGLPVDGRIKPLGRGKPAALGGKAHVLRDHQNP